MAARLTIAEARRLGLAVPARPKSPDGMNGTERLFAWLLDQAVRDEWLLRWWREPFRLRLAGHTTYKPDFLVWPKCQTRLSIVEIKGFMRDDASVKIKVAAEIYSCFDWWLVYKGRGGGWDVRKVTSRGIGRESFAPAQIWGAM